MYKGVSGGESKTCPLITPAREGASVSVPGWVLSGCVIEGVSGGALESMLEDVWTCVRGYVRS